MTQVMFLTSTWSSSEVGALVKTHGAWGGRRARGLNYIDPAFGVSFREEVLVL